MTRILLAERQPIYQLGMKAILKTPSVQFGMASDLEGLYLLLQNAPHDVLLLDSQFDLALGLGLVKLIRSQFPRMKVIVVSPDTHDSVILKTMQLGADAFLSRNSAPQVVKDAIKAVLRDKKYILSSSVKNGEDSQPDIHDLMRTLSERERQILKMLVSGQTVTQIARELDLNVKTVSTYRTRILQKSGFKNNMDLIRYGLNALAGID